MVVLIKKITRFVHLDLTEVEFAAKNPWTKRLIRQARITLYVVKRLVMGRHTERAAALTYLSLLSIIPFVAVVFSLLTAVSAGEKAMTDRAQKFLLDFIPDSSQQVSSWLASFIANFHAGTVGLVGMGALLVTVLLTLSAIEDALNKTWSVSKTRSWGMRLVVYWLLLTIGPLLIGASLAATATVQTKAATDALSGIPFIGLLKALVPLFATSLAFTALYYILPSAKVSIRAAWIGGIFAAALFELVKWAYALYASRSVSANALYGSLAAFPVFVIWLNYSWRIVLFGADVVHATHYASSDPTEETDPRTNQATREEAAVRMAALVAQAFISGERPPTACDLTQKLMLPAHLVDLLCRHMLAGGLFREERASQGLLPARPPTQLTMADVVRLMRHEIGVAHWPLRSDSADLIDRLLSGTERDSFDKMHAVSWAELAKDPLGKEEPDKNY